MIGHIRLMLYEEIQDAAVEEVRKKVPTREEAVAIRLGAYKTKQKAISEVLPHILSFLFWHECVNVPKVSRRWNEGTNMYQDYLDIRNSIPWQCYRPHKGEVESMLIHGRRIFSGGDRRILCSDFHTGETLAVVTRESGDVPFLAEKDEELFTCSSNGSVRTYLITHDAKAMTPVSRRVVVVLNPYHGQTFPSCLRFSSSLLCCMFVQEQDYVEPQPQRKARRV
jgi:hypothetical protein